MRGTGRRLLPLAVSLFLCPAVSADPLLGQLERALSLVKAKEYQAAIDRVSPLFEGLKLDTVEQIILAHKILGVSNCELGDQAKAEEHFKALLTFSPTESIRDVVATKPCAHMYARLQSAELGTQPQEPVPAAPAPKVEPTPLPTPLPPVTSSPPEPKGGAWKRYVPFGVGQFANDQDAKGMAFLTTESIAAATAGVMFGLFQAEKNPNGTFDNTGRANAYRAMFWSGVGIGTIAAVWGILDAVWVYKLSFRLQPAGTFVSCSF
jgi:hypothetical protein